MSVVLKVRKPDIRGQEVWLAHERMTQLTMGCLLGNHLFLAFLQILKDWGVVDGVRSTVRVQTWLLPTLQTTSHKLSLHLLGRSFRMEPI